MRTASIYIVSEQSQCSRARTCIAAMIFPPLRGNIWFDVRFRRWRILACHAVSCAVGRASIFQSRV